MTWKAKISYTDGRLDLVEPDSLVSADVLPKLASPLAPTWRFRFDDLKNGLWVDAYAFSTDKTRTVTDRPAPAAPFEATVSLQLLDSADMAAVHSVEVDGEIWLLRVDGDLLRLAPVLAKADELGVARDKQPPLGTVRLVLEELWAQQGMSAVDALCKCADIPNALQAFLLPAADVGKAKGDPERQGNEDISKYKPNDDGFAAEPED